MKKSVILAAGKGTRMKSVYPKVIHKVCGKEMVNHVIYSSTKAGVDENIIVLGHGIEEVRSVLPDEVRSVVQKEQLGTGHAVMMAENYINNDDTVVVLCGDTPLITSETLERLFSYHENNGCSVTVLTTEVDNPTGYGRVIRDVEGNIVKIVEQKDASEEEKLVKEINSGIYCFNGGYLLESLKKINNDNAQGEYYLPDTIEIIRNIGGKVHAFLGASIKELMGVNSRLQLHDAEKIMRRRINEIHMENGVTFIDSDSTYIDSDIEIGNDTIIMPGCVLSRGSKIGVGCEIGPFSTIENSVIGDGTVVKKSEVIDAKIGDATSVGPYAYIRPKSDVGNNCKVGDFVEIKNAKFGDGSKASHLSYIGDAVVGENVNIGCGVVFANYDGKKKYQSTVGDNAFIGSNSNLVAPVTVEEDSFIATGSTITDNVPAGSLSIARARQINKDGWVEKKRKNNEE